MLMENNLKCTFVVSLTHNNLYFLSRAECRVATVELSSIGDMFDRVERNATASFVVDLRGMRIVTRDKSSREKRS